MNNLGAATAQMMSREAYAKRYAPRPNPNGKGPPVIQIEPGQLELDLLAVMLDIRELIIMVLTRQGAVVAKNGIITP